VYSLDHEQMKEALCYSVIPAVTFPAHAACESTAMQESLKKVTCVLTSTVKVAHGLSHLNAAFNSHVQSTAHQICGHPAVK
jgi:hypothetical protein